VAVVCLDVAARNLKLFATPWALDVSEYLLYAITFLGARVCAVLVYSAGRVFWRSYSANNLVYETFVFPEWYLYCLAPPVFLLLLLLFLRRLGRGA
jgi:TRAP-type C4-dicarboxylate transport system permease small subunit